MVNLDNYSVNTAQIDGKYPISAQDHLNAQLLKEIITKLDQLLVK